MIQGPIAKPAPVLPHLDPKPPLARCPSNNVIPSSARNNQLPVNALGKSPLDNVKPAIKLDNYPNPKIGGNLP